MEIWRNHWCIEEHKLLVVAYTKYWEHQGYVHISRERCYWAPCSHHSINITSENGFTHWVSPWRIIPFFHQHLPTKSNTSPILCRLLLFSIFNWHISNFCPHTSGEYHMASAVCFQFFLWRTWTLLTSSSSSTSKPYFSLLGFKSFQMPMWP